jgi:hypothetical protein
LQGVWRQTQTQAGRLLRVLLVWNCALSTNPGWRALSLICKGRQLVRLLAPSLSSRDVFHLIDFLLLPADDLAADDCRAVAVDRKTASSRASRLTCAAMGSAALNSSGCCEMFER